MSANFAGSNIVLPHSAHVKENIWVFEMGDVGRKSTLTSFLSVLTMIDHCCMAKTEIKIQSLTLM